MSEINITKKQAHFLLANDVLCDSAMVMCKDYGACGDPERMGSYSQIYKEEIEDMMSDDYFDDDDFQIWVV